MTAPQSSAPNKDKLTVFYDGSCPLCAREVAFYQKLRGADGVEWQDVSGCEAEEVQPGLSKTEALARFHARTADGSLLSGAKAFLAVWRVLPAFRPLARLGQIPPLPWLLEWGYRGFLRFRPVLQRMVARR